jgi:hypothetical protein
VNTRCKIVDAAGCCGKGPVTLITGYFDPLLAWHAQACESVRRRAAAIAVVVLPLAGELLPQRARAVLVAALRATDYVLIADNKDLERLFAELNPVEIVRLEDDDLRRRGELIDHVRR